MEISRFDTYDHSQLRSDKGVILSADDHDNDIRKQIEARVRDYVRKYSVKGSGFDQDTLEHLHLYLPADQVGDCTSYVNKSLQHELFEWCIRSCRNRLGFPNHFYIDEKIYIRINVPYDYGVKGQPSNKPVEGALKRLQSRLFGKKLKHHNPLVAYNKNRPRATWSHGPHIDTWYGHSYTATNFWFSVCGTNPSASMVLFPEHYRKNIPFDPDNMYATSDVALRDAYELSLSPGENFVFDPELLHSTRLNTSTETRIVVTIRVSSEEPTFSSATTHAVYDKWLTTEDIEQQKLIASKVGRRISAPDYPSLEQTPVFSVSLPMNRSELSATSVLSSSIFGDAPQGIPFHLALSDSRETAVIEDSHVYVVSSQCPHIGAPLERGSFSNGRIRCPAHGATFCVKSGESECASLKIRTQSIVLTE